MSYVYLKTEISEFFFIMEQKFLKNIFCSLKNRKSSIFCKKNLKKKLYPLKNRNSSTLYKKPMNFFIFTETNISKLFIISNLKRESLKYFYGSYPKKHQRLFLREVVLFLNILYFFLYSTNFCFSSSGKCLHHV